MLLGVVGSTAYGLAREGSDVDRIGVYVAPTAERLRLYPPKRESHVDTDPDTTIHEIGKYLLLALKGNPTITELMWLPHYQKINQDGYDLITMRTKVLSTERVRGAYGGYARDQIKKLVLRQSAGKRGFSADTQNRTAKHARHCFRLIEQGKYLLETGQLKLLVDNPEDYWVFDDMPVDNMVRRFNEADKAFMEAKSVLPDKPDVETVEKWFAGLRRKHYR